MLVTSCYFLFPLWYLTKVLPAVLQYQIRRSESLLHSPAGFEGVLAVVLLQEKQVSHVRAAVAS